MRAHRRESLETSRVYDNQNWTVHLVLFAEYASTVRTIPPQEKDKTGAAAPALDT